MTQMSISVLIAADKELPLLMGVSRLAVVVLFKGKQVNVMVYSPIPSLHIASPHSNHVTSSKLLDTCIFISGHVMP